MVTLVQDKSRAVPSPGNPPARAFRTILAHVSGDAEEAPRLGAAVSLARSLDATLLGVGCEMAPPLAAADPSGMMQAEWLISMQDVVRANLERAHQLFLSEAKDLKTDWVALQGLPVETVTRLSRSADLIVAGGGASGRIDRHRAIDTGELLMRSGRPVLVAPPAGGELKANSIVVAWKDAREARRALADALPFLQAAENVLVVDVCHQSETLEAEVRTGAVLEGLARHGVTAQAKVVAAPSHRVAAELNVAAQGAGADLIVAGGYGHSRLGEWVFGGVTQDLLHFPERFVLLSH